MLWLLVKYLLYVVVTVALLAVGFAAYLIWFQPPCYFPKPTGQYAIGTREFSLEDRMRQEMLFVVDPEHPYRELMVQVWYPVDPRLLPQSPVPYQKSSFYSFAANGAEIYTTDAPFPLIVYSHGLNETRKDNTAQCEELASHGYIVVGIDHPYVARTVTFPDKRVKSHLLNTKLEAIEHGTDKDLFMSLVLDTVLVPDIRFVIDYVIACNNDVHSPFFRTIDANKIGIFGHSMGGTAAVHILDQDPRVECGIDLDGFLVYGKPIGDDFHKPLMFMVSEEFFCRKLDVAPEQLTTIEGLKKLRYALGYPSIEYLFRTNRADTYKIILRGSKHLTYSDYALLFPQASVPKNATQIINAYCVAFFDRYLKGKEAVVLEGKSNQFVEVETRLT